MSSSTRSFPSEMSNNKSERFQMLINNIFLRITNATELFDTFIIIIIIIIMTNSSVPKLKN